MKKLIKEIIEIYALILYKLNILRAVVIDTKYEVYKTKYKHTFFGYYDKTPFSNDNLKILSIATNHDNVLTKPEEAVIGYFDKESKVFVEIGITTTWCWQQGCRLMWFDEHTVIYNKVVDDDYGSVIYNLNTKEEIKRFNFPVYDKSFDNKYALSLNFSRLHYFRPGYGYVNYMAEADKLKIKNDDGVYLCSFENNTKLLIISMDTILSSEFDNSMEDACHYINHLKFAPNDYCFIFYHIWVKNNKRYTRTLLATIEGKILKVLNNKTFMSHDTFKDKKHLLIFTKTYQNGYHLYNLDTEEKKIININLKDDGHPSFLNDNTFLTDCYPSRFIKQQKLMMVNETNINIFAKIYSPKKFRGEIRCDLHPRFSLDKKYISIDCPVGKYREMIIMENNNEII